MLLIELIDRLGEKERKELQRRLDGADSLAATMIRSVLDHTALDRASLIERLGTTRSTFDKVHSQALDTVYLVLQTTLNNPYDPIMLVRKLLLMGLASQARRLYRALEKEYEREMRYAVLDTLYHEGVRLAYDNGDGDWLARLEKQVNTNSLNLARYNKLDKGLARLMLLLERGRKRCGPDVGRRINTVHSEAVRFGHPVPIINALYCRHIYHLRHRFDQQQALDALGEIMKASERYRAHLDNYSLGIAAANHASFICTYDVQENPEPSFAIVDRIIGEGGTLGPLVTSFQRLRYFLCTGEIRKGRRVMERIEALPDDNRFVPLKSAAAAWIAFGERDVAAFRDALQRFYTHPTYQDLPEQEFELRVIDLLFLLREAEHETVMQRAETLRKFVERHFEEPYRSECSHLLKCILHSASTPPRRQRRPPPPHRFMQRAHAFIAGQITADLTA